MSTTNVIKLAGAIKPSASRTEIIEALAIRKREQIVKEIADARKELIALETKLQAVAAEEIAKGGRVDSSNCCRNNTYSFHVGESEGRLTVANITCRFSVKPSLEFAELARKHHRLYRATLRHEPSLHEVRQQVRAALANQTPPAMRVKSLLSNPETQKMLDTLLGQLDKKPLMLTA